MPLLGDYPNVSGVSIIRARYSYPDIDNSDTKSGTDLDIKEYNIVITYHSRFFNIGVIIHILVEAIDQSIN